MLSMSSVHHHPLRWDGWLPSVLGLGAALAAGLSAMGWLALPVFVLLLLAVRAAVHHAETVAARVGEPFEPSRSPWPSRSSRWRWSPPSW